MCSACGNCLVRIRVTSSEPIRKSLALRRFEWIRTFKMLTRSRSAVEYWKTIDCCEVEKRALVILVLYVRVLADMFGSSV